MQDKERKTPGADPVLVANFGGDRLVKVGGMRRNDPSVFPLGKRMATAT
jgi:hypothetical protein